MNVDNLVCGIHRAKVLEEIEQLAICADKLNAVEVDEIEMLIDPFENTPHMVMTGPCEGDEAYQWTYKYRYNPEDNATKQFVDLLSSLYEDINSKDGARMLPRGLFRALLEFSDKCEKCKDWQEWHYGKTLEARDVTKLPEEIVKEYASKHELRPKIKKFLEEVKAIKREILIYENERDEKEASFVGK